MPSDPKPAGRRPAFTIEPVSVVESGVPPEPTIPVADAAALLLGACVLAEMGGIPPERLSHLAALLNRAAPTVDALRATAREILRARGCRL